jgi:hypothetical protein
MSIEKRTRAAPLFCLAVIKAHSRRRCNETALAPPVLYDGQRYAHWPLRTNARERKRPVPPNIRNQGIVNFVFAEAASWLSQPYLPHEGPLKYSLIGIVFLMGTFVGHMLTRKLWDATACPIYISTCLESSGPVIVGLNALPYASNAIRISNRPH